MGESASVDHAMGKAYEGLTYNGKAFDVRVLLARAIVWEEYLPTIVRPTVAPNLGGMTNCSSRPMAMARARGSGQTGALLALFESQVKSNTGGTRVAAPDADNQRIKFHAIAR
jgi:hypothetical protein